MNASMKALIFPILLATTLGASAQGTSEGATNYFTTFGGSVPGTAGYTFQTKEIITVTALGAFSYVLSNQTPVTVGLWNDSGVLLGSASVALTNALSTALAHYSSITPVALSPEQTYHIGAFSPNGALATGVSLPTDGGFLYLAPELILRGSASSSSEGLAFPAEEEGANGAAYVAPNFLFQPIPEPSTLALAAMGGIALLFGLRRNPRR